MNKRLNYDEVPELYRELLRQSQVGVDKVVVQNQEGINKVHFWYRLLISALTLIFVLGGGVAVVLGFRSIKDVNSRVNAAVSKAVSGVVENYERTTVEANTKLQTTIEDIRKQMVEKIEIAFEEENIQALVSAEAEKVVGNEARDLLRNVKKQDINPLISELEEYSQNVYSLVDSIIIGLYFESALRDSRDAFEHLLDYRKNYNWNNRIKKDAFEEKFQGLINSIDNTNIAYCYEFPHDKNFERIRKEMKADDIKNYISTTDQRYHYTIFRVIDESIILKPAEKFDIFRYALQFEVSLYNSMFLGNALKRLSPNLKESDVEKYDFPRMIKEIAP